MHLPTQLELFKNGLGATIIRHEVACSITRPHLHGTYVGHPQMTFEFISHSFQESS
jgi:hypothetical protein